MNPAATAGRATTAAAVAWVVVGVIVVALAVATMLRKPPELPVLGQVPSFSLLDQEGATFPSERLAGRVWVANFLYTSCPGPCPVMVEKLAQLRRRIDPGDLAIVSFSVDPDTDTVDILGDYARDHAIAASQSWWLATGSRQQVLDVIEKGFLVTVSREDGGEGPPEAASGPIIHTTRLMLVDGDGRIRGAYSSEDAEDLARLEEDAKRLASLPSPRRDVSS